jgi:Flp pilus assembly CpaE family ATPase
VVAALAVGGVLLAMMIAASGYAAVILPGDARIPLHLGSHQHVVLVSKRAGLGIWPAAGAVLYGILGGVSASSLASDWVPGVRDVLMPAVMVVVLGFQVGALVVGAGEEPRSVRIKGS